MAFKEWDKLSIRTGSGSECAAIAPVIVSASRSTDIPGFYSKWFIDRLNQGHVVWVNPFNRRSQYVSFQETRVIVFWTKNPEPIRHYLNEIDQKGIHYYFQYTLNDYENEGFEPGVPLIEKRIETFCRLSEKLGKARVIWRFDPLILTHSSGVEELLEKIRGIGDQIHAFTENLVISFVDINAYRKVRNNFRSHHIDGREFDAQKMADLAKGLESLNQSWKLKIATCGETADLKRYGICHNRCIDGALMVRLFQADTRLMTFLGYRKGVIPGCDDWAYLKDKGQRKACGCIVSKDIGMYGTCGHGCVYCYASRFPGSAPKNRDNRDGLF
jgi:DNA repair photolyase